MEVERMKI